MRENKEQNLRVVDTEVSSEPMFIDGTDGHQNRLLSKELVDNALELLSKVYRFSPGNISMRRNISQEHGIVVDEEPQALKVTYNDLPTDVLVHIFSFLDVISLCKVSCINRIWNGVANDSLLWQNKLSTDSYQWERIDHLSHPKLHFETNPELSPKEIYLRCCSECRHLRKRSLHLPTHLPNLSYFFGFSVPRIVMFGSGLDSSGLVKRVLWDQRSPFTVKGMFPGKFEGMGSGVSLGCSAGNIDLICMYALFRAERENQNLNAERKSRLLVGDDRQISQPIKELCSTVDAFIYIVNGTTQNRVTFGCEEFKALIDDRWLQPKVPVLVLCVVENATIPSVSSLEVSNRLELLKLSRPWQVRQCHVDSLYGFLPGVTWLNKHVIGL